LGKKRFQGGKRGHKKPFMTESEMSAILAEFARLSCT